MSEQVNVVMVSGHTLTCPSSDSGDEDSTIPLVVGRTEGIRAMVWYIMQLKQHILRTETKNTG